MFLIFRHIKEKEEPRQIKLSREEGLHLRAARISTKEKIYVGDGRHRRWPMRFEAKKGVQRQEYTANLCGPFQSHKEALRLVCMALPERSRLEKEFIPGAVQLGMSHFQPLICEHSVRSWFTKERTRSILKEAACQSRRFFLPHLLRTKSIESLHKFLERISLPPANILAFHPKAKLSLSSYAKDHPKLENEGVALLIGPEGGFSQGELASFQEKSYPLLRLGSGENILRVSTAALASLAKLL